MNKEELRSLVLVALGMVTFLNVVGVVFWHFHINPM